MTFPVVEADLDRHLDTFDNADRLARIGSLIESLQEWLSQLDGMIQTEDGQTRKHLNAVYNTLCNELYSLESIAENLR